MSRISQLYDLIKLTHPRAFEMLNCMSYLKGNKVGLEFMGLIFRHFSSNDISKSIGFLHEQSLINLNTDDLTDLTYEIEDDIKREVMERVNVNLDEKAIVLDGIVLGLNSLLSLQGVEKNDYNKFDPGLKNLFYHSLHVLNNEWKSKQTNPQTAEYVAN